MLNLSTQKNKIPVFSRAEVLADVVSLKNIIVTGSHGKTTTTSLVGKILFRSKIRPDYYKWRSDKLS